MRHISGYSELASPILVNLPYDEMHCKQSIYMDVWSAKKPVNIFSTGLFFEEKINISPMCLNIMVWNNTAIVTVFYSSGR
jgi:hypothetical protein